MLFCVQSDKRVFDIIFLLRGLNYIRMTNKFFNKYKAYLDSIIFSDGSLFKLNELEFMPFGHMCWWNFKICCMKDESELYAVTGHWNTCGWCWGDGGKEREKEVMGRLRTEIRVEKLNAYWGNSKLKRQPTCGILSSHYHVGCYLDMHADCQF